MVLITSLFGYKLKAYAIFFVFLSLHYLFIYLFSLFYFIYLFIFFLLICEQTSFNEQKNFRS